MHLSKLKLQIIASLFLARYVVLERLPQSKGNLDERSNCFPPLPAPGVCPTVQPTIQPTITTTTPPTSASPSTSQPPWQTSTKGTTSPSSTTSTTTTPTPSSAETTISSTITTTTKNSTLESEADNPDPESNNVKNSDPFYSQPGAEQLSCNSTGVSCSTCSFMDWLKIYNKTIDGAVPPVEILSNSNEQSCFQSCISTSSCILYTFHGANGTCKIYDRVDFERIQNSTDWSLYVRYYPKFLFLNEWIVTLNTIPREAPFQNRTLPDFFSCIMSCSSSAQVKCAYATFNTTSSTCNLYTKGAATQMMAFQSGLISISHFSLMRNDNMWRFAALGPIYQSQESPNASVTDSVQSCVENCNYKDACQLATTSATNRSTVNCYLYNSFGNIWYEDEPPTRITHSYFKLVPRNNTKFRQIPYFMSVSTDSPALDSISTTDLHGCHRRALNSSGTYWYSFNSSMAMCTLYDSSVKIVKHRGAVPNELFTFSKSIPTTRLAYYAYDSMWVANLSDYQEESELLGEDCLEACLEREGCSGVAVQRPEGNCTFYSLVELNKIRGEYRNQTFSGGAHSVQLFAKLGDPRFLKPSQKYSCFDHRQVSWEEVNQILKFGSLRDVRDELPVGNNAPTEPHGGGFQGQRNGVPSPTFKYQKLGSADEVELRWQRGSRELHGTLETFGAIAGAVAGSGVGSAGGPEGTIVGGTLGAAAGAWAGKQIANFIDTVACWFTKCEPPKKEPDEESCELACNRTRNKNPLKLGTRTNDCRCWGQPEVRRRGGDPDEDASYPDLQENCRGRWIGQRCNICCKVGYEAEQDPICSCSNTNNNYWDPDPAICKPETNCHFATATYGHLQMPMIRITNCQDELYYGTVFNTIKKIPFYSVYHYGARNLGRGHSRTGKDFVAFPCTDNGLDESQLTDGDYAAMNSIHTYPVYYLDKGHLAPHSNFEFSEDSVKSTFFYLNAAPQDHNANVKWANVETRLPRVFGQTLPNGRLRQGYVMTGVCLDDDPVYPVPECFWKLACTITDSGQVTVAAFYHTNVLSTNQMLKNERSREIYQIRDQRQLPLVGLMQPHELPDLWEQAANFFPGFNLFGNNQDFYDCHNANSINFPQFPLPSTPRSGARADEDDDEYELYYFWHDNIFGEGFNETVDESATDTQIYGQSNAGSPPSCGKKVVGYVTGWSDIRFSPSVASYLTHVIFAFVQMLGDGTLVVGSADPENSKDVSVDTRKSYLRLYEIKSAKEKSGSRLRTIFAVGGWANSQFYSAVAGSPSMTQNFIRSALQIIDYFDMDGIDIDWEYPVTGGAQEGVKEDRTNYLNLLRALRSALDQHQTDKGRSIPYSLTIAGAAGSWVLDDGFDLPAIAAVVDWINVMTYDYYGAWDSKWGAYTGPHAPLYYGAPQGYSGKTNVDYTLKYYLCRVGNPEKLVMGLGFYGRFWNSSGSPVGNDPVWRKANPNGAGKFDGGFEPWRYILKYLGDDSYAKHFHEKTKTPYLDNSGGFLMGYEDPQSIFEKVKYAAGKDFGGVMIWAVDLDDDQSTLLRTASSETLCSGSTNVPRGYKCPPIQDQRWWTLLDDERKAGMCGKAAPLYKGYYPVCDPEDPGYACCSASGYCGSGDDFCDCEGCVNYYENPEKILDEPIRPSGPVRWHTMDKFESGPQCGYEGHKLESGDFAICNPDDNNGYCCSSAGYCGKTSEFCECEGCVNFRENPNFEYPEKTWIDSGPDAGKCGTNGQVNGKPATCNPMSSDYHCCSSSGFCGSGSEYCDCDGCIDYKK